MSTPDDKAKARAFRMIVASAEEDRYVEELEKKTDDELMAMVGDRGKAFLEKSRGMIGDMQKAAAFRAIVEQAKEDELEKELEGKNLEDLPPRAKAALERTRKMLRDMPVAENEAKVVDIRTAKGWRRAIPHVANTVVTLTAVAAAILIFLTNHRILPTKQVDLPTAGGVWTDAEQNRALAAAAYARGDFDACIRHLDLALRFDQGEVVPEEVGSARELRKQCTMHLPPPGTK